MIFNIYVLYDTAGQQYLMPSFELTDESSIRNLVASILMNKDSIIYFQPQDYMLYCVGSYDKENGKLESCLPRLVGRVGDFLKGVKEDV